MALLKNNYTAPLGPRTGPNKDGTGDKIVIINPGEVKMVEGFNPNDPVHADWLAKRWLLTSRGDRRQADDAERNKALQVDLTNAENAVKQAKDDLAAAVDAANAQGAGGKEQKAVATAEKAVKDAEAKHAKAQEAFDAG
jgi:hypothetical protein